jgi:hypothetical protein
MESIASDKSELLVLLTHPSLIPHDRRNEDAPTMSAFQIKEYDPNKPVYSAQIDDSKWGAHEEDIREMHQARFTRKQMLKTLAESHAFHPS